MDYSAWRKQLLSFPDTSEGEPFGPDVLVYKTAGKMFALLSERKGQGNLSLKCDPDRSLQLRARFPSITAGYHLNKEHWNTIVLDGSVADELIQELCAHSWERVVAGMKKAERERLHLLYGAEQ